MLDVPALFATLENEGLGSWAEILEPLIAGRIADGAHGNLREWRDALSQLPDAGRHEAKLAGGSVATTPFELGDKAGPLKDALLRLRPWRKGPFRIGTVDVDAEWRSDLKWDRVKSMISPLADRLVLDVGCGNGYYALRMVLDGARTVIGVDPTLLYVIQYQALSHFFEPMPIAILPLRLDDLPAGSKAFDTVFSMGVLYHQRAPVDHLRTLRDALRPGGELVLETLILPGDVALSRTPQDRYARMRNVWHLPSVPELETWLARAGFRDIGVGPGVETTPDEQRSTEWMPFESLVEALDSNGSLTVEGWPAPLRVALVARVP